ncbi:MAG TPA: 50S ribosomal protein L32 [Candidatus Binatia bacterium]|nr:50S ribosomal protein L32 [Candidatus Binatia bacterium]
MGLPKRKTSKSKRNQRRSHDALAAPQWLSCPQCGEPVVPHRICAACGYYRGRQVITVAEEE